MCYLSVPYVNYQTCSKQIKSQQVYSFLFNLSEGLFCYSHTFFRMSVPQWITIFSGLRDLAGNRYDFISVILALLKFLVTTLLLSSDSSQPLMYFTKELSSITVRGIFLCVLFFVCIHLFHMLSFNHFIFGCHWFSRFS